MAKGIWAEDWAHCEQYAGTFWDCRFGRMRNPADGGQPFRLIAGSQYE